MMLLLFAGGELYYRYVYDTTDSLSYTKVSQRWFQRYFVYNPSGFRDNVEYRRLRQPGVRRITFVGDSFTVGHGIRSVDDRFANLIRAAHPEWEIHVVGHIGLDTGAELALMQKSLKEGYQIDEVVLVYCLNDVADVLPQWNKDLKRIFADENQGGWLRQHSYFIDTLYHHYKAAHDPAMQHYFDFVRSGYSGPVWELQQKRLMEFRDIVRTNGGRLLVVTFPFLNALGPKYPYRSIHEKLDQFWKKLGVPNLDLLPIYANLPPAKLTVNPYDAHPNEYAHALAAKAIGKFLVTQLSNSPLSALVSSNTVSSPPR